MRHLLLFAVLAASLVLAPTVSKAGTVFNFEGEDENGVGSAKMTFTVTGYMLTVLLDNDSPITTETDPPSLNKPGIIGFGFDLKDVVPTLLSWSFNAKDNMNNDVLLGSGGDDELWEMYGTGDRPPGQGLGALEFDFYPGVSSTSEGKLYNPLLQGVLSGDYFTRATLVMNFSSLPELKPTEGSSPFVRMQDVGVGAEGSLKLFGVRDDDVTGGPLPPVPEPGSLVLWGLLGMVGLAWRIRRKVRA